MSLELFLYVRENWSFFVIKSARNPTHCHIFHTNIFCRGFRVILDQTHVWGLLLQVPLHHWRLAISFKNRLLSCAIWSNSSVATMPLRYFLMFEALEFDIKNINLLLFWKLSIPKYLSVLEFHIGYVTLLANNSVR